MVTHTVKYVSRNAHPLTAIGGSGGGLTGAARAIYLFGVDPADAHQRAMVPVKFNLGPSPMSVTFEMDEIEWRDDDDRLLGTAGKLLLASDDERINPLAVMAADAGHGTGSKTAEKREAAAEWLTNYLALGERPVNELKEDLIQAGMSWGTLRRAAEQDVEVVRRREGFGRGSKVFWALPDGHPALVESDDPPEGTIEAALEKLMEEDGDA